MKLFSMIALAIVHFACQSGSSDQSDKNNTDQYAYINAVIEKDESIIIDADYVQFLTGDSAIEAAKNAHAADTVIIDGKMQIDVANDYFILNENNKTRKLELSKQIAFDLLLDLDRADSSKVIKDNSFTSFKKIYKDNLFLLSITNNKVGKIKEVFLP